MKCFMFMYLNYKQYPVDQNSTHKHYMYYFRIYAHIKHKSLNFTLPEVELHFNATSPYYTHH